MTHSDFDLDPRSQQGALAASAAPDSGTAAGEVLAHGETANENRKVTFQDTPALWPLPAVVSWRLARDPSAVNALCKPLSAQRHEPSSWGDEIDRGRRGNARLLDVGAEHGEFLQGRHGDNIPAAHGVETHPVLELGRVVDLDAT